MYPAHYFGLFPPFPKHERRVFVGMTFREEHDARWRNLIEPAIIAAGLEAYRVNRPTSGGSILSDILDGLAESRLILLEISKVEVTDSPNRPADRTVRYARERNANVMWEFGIATAIRQPEEIIAIRDDDDPLPFDVTALRVHHYNPDSVDAARDRVTELCLQAVRNVDDARNAAVQATLPTLSYFERNILWSACFTGPVSEPGPGPAMYTTGIGAARAAFSRLLTLGALERLPPEFLTDPGTPNRLKAVTDYRATSFGRALMELERQSLNAAIGTARVTQESAAGEAGTS